MLVPLLAQLHGAAPTPAIPGPMDDEDAGISLVWIAPGSFRMGSDAAEPGRQGDEVFHLTGLTHGFWIGATEVTQEQWTRIMGANPSHFASCGPRCPVESVSWNEVQVFLTRLNARSDGGFRLPTEAEWEYACRAGSPKPFSTGDRLGRENANFDGRRPLPVASFPPNAWGLFDMHGNVWEWCGDWYGAYETTRLEDPTGPPAGEKKVIRGGSFSFGADSCRCALRYTHRPADRGFSVGFRVVRDARTRRSNRAPHTGRVSRSSWTRRSRAPDPARRARRPAGRPSSVTRRRTLAVPLAACERTRACSGAARRPGPPPRGS